MRPPGAARSVIVTGAARGIGAALASRFARCGARVAALDRDAEGAAARAAQLEREGCAALGLACDVTSPEQCQAAVTRVLEAWGRIDVLVNNAGITHLGRVAETELAVLRRVMEVNFFGAVQCTKAALPALLANRGRVVAMSSVAGFAPLATRAGYAASKHALHGFFGSLRAEYAGQGLGVTLVCPSFVRTDIGASALGARGEAAGPGARSGVGREIEPEAAAEAIHRGVEAGRRLVFVGREARLAWWLAQLWPAAYERLMVRRTLGA